MKLKNLWPGVFIGVLLTIGNLVAQTVHKIPFASHGNSIELSVTNALAVPVNNIRVEIKDVPSWVNFSSSNQIIKTLQPNGDGCASFSFSVTKDAPIGKDESLTFDISTPSNEHWTKQVILTVMAPVRYTLFQNYPNPFNPETKIDFTLPKTGQVRLIIYNFLGQEITTLVDDVEDPGYKTVSFDASKLPSGIYFYRLQTEKFSDIRKMVLIK